MPIDPVWLTQATWENPWRRGVGGDAWLTDHAYLGYGGDMPIDAPAYAGGGASRFGFAQPSIQATGGGTGTVGYAGQAQPAARIRNPLPEMLPRFAEMQQGVGDALQREANWQRIGETQAQRIRNPLPEMLPRFAEFQQGLGEAMSQEDLDLLQWAKSMRRQMVPR